MSINIAKDDAMRSKTHKRQEVQTEIILWALDMLLLSVAR